MSSSSAGSVPAAPGGSNIGVQDLGDSRLETRDSGLRALCVCAIRGCGWKVWGICISGSVGLLERLDSLERPSFGRKNKTLGLGLVLVNARSRKPTRSLGVVPTALGCAPLGSFLEPPCCGCTAPQPQLLLPPCKQTQSPAPRRWRTPRLTPPLPSSDHRQARLAPWPCRQRHPTPS